MVVRFRLATAVLAACLLGESALAQAPMSFSLDAILIGSIGTDEPDLEPLSERLWRRYGRRAFEMLEAIRQDPTMGERIIARADYLRVELHLAARTEMVTRLEDFLRRRSKISQVVHDADIEASPGLHEAAEILFGDDADRRLAEYFGTVHASPE